MGRTMQRERKKQANNGVSAAGVAKQATKPTPKNPSSHVNLVSAAFAAQNWKEVITRLEAMRRSGEVPKLGTCQRWVRMADLCGDERVAASLLSSVLRCIPGSGGPMVSLPIQGKKSKGSKPGGPVRRHAPWAPPLSAQQQAWINAAGSSAPPPTPSADYRSCMSPVPQDGSTQPSRRPPNWAELRIWQPAPGTIRFVNPDPKAVRVDVPFVPGAFVLVGLLAPDECRQLVAATEACGYRWDVDYTFNPSNPDSAATAEPEPTESTAAPDIQPASTPPPAADPPQQQPDAATCNHSSQPTNPSTSQTEASLSALLNLHNQLSPFNNPSQSQPSNGSTAPSQPAPHTGSSQTTPAGPQTSDHQATGPSHQQPPTRPSHETVLGSQQEAEPSRHSSDDKHDRVCDDKHDDSTGRCASHQQAGPSHPLLSAARTVAGGDRAAGCVWLAGADLMAAVLRRATPLLPAKCGGKALAGINARWRFYRYDAGNVYRPHIDGAWPGSGIKDGKLCHDAFGDRWSHYTFLIYLNDDFEGGSTTFFTPAPDDRMALDARGVQPRTGNVLCFPHGDTAASLVHEGSAVTRGAKYVIRTDVLYFT